MPGGTKLPSAGSGSELREFVWSPDESIGSGVYLVRARFDRLTDRGEKDISKRVVYLK